jgi:seryl-tRNA synthetase
LICTITIKKAEGKIMYTRLKNDLEEGLNKIKWFAGLLSERVRIELTVFRLLYRAEELKKKRDSLFKKIGEEVYHMHNAEKSFHPSMEIMAIIREIEALEPQIREAVDKASEIDRITS